MRARPTIDGPLRPPFPLLRRRRAGVDGEGELALHAPADESLERVGQGLERHELVDGAAQPPLKAGSALAYRHAGAARAQPPARVRCSA